MLPRKTIVSLPNFKLKALNSDFVVDEVYLEPPYSAKAQATHTYLLIEKENITTFGLLEHLAGYFKLPEADVSASGLKDEYAVARQAVSLRTIIAEEAVQQANDYFSNSGLQLSITRLLGYGQSPLNPRYLHGNKFTITIRQLSAEIAGLLADTLSKNRFFQFINYYDEQRFGLPDSIHNTSTIGSALLADDWSTAYQEYLRSGINAVEIARAKAALARFGSYQEAMMNAVASKLDFFVSSYNSRLWNGQLKQSIDQLPHVTQANFPYLGKISLPTDPATPLSPFLSIEVERKDWKSDTSYQTSKTRPVVIPVPVFLMDQFDDPLHTGDHQAVTISFYLPTGCYATMLVKQLLLTAVLQQR